MPAQPLRDIPRQPGRNPGSQPRRLLVRSMSPEEEAIGMLDDLGNPLGEGFGWSPMQWIAEKATAAAGALADAGKAIYNKTLGGAQDVVSTLNAAITGEAPEAPGPLFTLAAGAASSFNRLLPERVQEKLGTKTASNIAGYITLPDGTRIPVPKAQDNQAQGEKAQSDALKAAIFKTNADAAAAKAKTRVEEQKLAATAAEKAVAAGQWSQMFELRQRAEAREQEMFELQKAAAQLALDKQTVMNRGPGWWNLPSRLAWEEEPPQRVVRAVGMGVEGGVVTRTAGWSLP